MKIYYVSVLSLEYHFLLILILLSFFSAGCEDLPAETRIKKMDAARVRSMAASVESLIKLEIKDSLTVHLWGIDSLVNSPIAIDIDDKGALYYTTTDRQKDTEFDIRAHHEWEIPSLKLQTIEEKREFLHEILSPANSAKNTWLKDLNSDSSHDWKDMTVQKEKVYRLLDVDGDGVAEQSQLVVDDFQDEVTDVAGGLLKHENDLFVAVGPDLWRMKDINGDGIPDGKTSISHGYGIHIGYSGHGMSGVEMGPDGRIYWQIGDIGFNGKGQDGKQWSYPNCGVIARSNPDGSDFEIFAYGIRNTHEFVFDEYGNLIGEDNDGDHSGEKERIVYIVNGSDAGWRSNWQYGKYKDPDNNTYKVWMEEKMWMTRFEGQAAYITPCVAHFISGPTGMVYNPGTALTPEYRNTFFIAEFVGNPAQSGVYSFKLKPKGASFELGENKKILGGILPTGLDFGPDGSLYIADWINGWETKGYGRIWKLDHKNQTSSTLRLQTQTLLADDFRKRNPTNLGELLKYPDMRVRLKSQFELVRRGQSGVVIFQESLRQSVHQLARIHGIWGISQLARKDKKHAQLLIPFLKDKDAEIRAQTAKWLGDMRYNAAGNLLIPLLQDEDSRTRFFAAEALGRIKFEKAIDPLISLLKNNNDEDAFIRHAASLALANIGQAKPLLALSTNHSHALRIAAVVALRRMNHPGIARFLADDDEFIVTETARAINDDLSIIDALPALGNLLKNTRFTNEALIRRVINANLRVGTKEALQNLLNYSINQNNPAAMRAEAIAALSTWVNPSVLDRVDGRYRGVIKRDSQLVNAQAGDALIGLLKSKMVEVRISAAKAISKLNVSVGAVPLLKLIKSDKEPGVRIEALRALSSLSNEHVPKGITLALSDRDRAVRIAGIDLIDQLTIPKELMVSLLSGVIQTKTIEEQQAAILTLGKLPVSKTKNVFDELLKKMASGKLSPSLYIELNEAIDRTQFAELIAKYQKVSKGLSADAFSAAYAGALFGGNSKEGKKIFFSNESAQCIKCHSYDDVGGNAGPRLNGIAQRLSRQQILEALINPGARLSPGYGVVTVELKNGQTLSGILKGEDNTGITLKAGDGPDNIISKAQIKKRVNAPSSMPVMKNILSKKEIRDVVSFLSTLKEMN